MRGLASFGVLCNHTLFSNMDPNAAWPWHLRLLQVGGFYGSYGVTLFFVLSGYLITSLLLLARRQQHYFSDFYWKRVFRILPALLLALAVIRSLGYIDNVSMVLAVAFIYNFHDLLHIPATGPFWSLSIEEQFYLLWPAAVRRLSARRLAQVLLGIALLEPVLRFASVMLHHGRMKYTFTNSDGIAWGAMLALLAMRYRVPFRRMNERRLWRRFGLPLLLAGGVVALPGEWLQWHLRPNYEATLLTAVLLFTSLMTFVITHRDSLLSRALRWPPLVFFGNISYMFYLSHAYVLQAFREHLETRMAAGPVARAYEEFLFTLVATTLLCTLSLYLFERPVGSLRRYFVHDGRRHA